MTDTDTREPAFEPEERWIPADRRWLGLDRRTVAPSLAVLALAFTMSAILPAVNDGVGYHDEVAAGDVIEVSGGITFVPEPGWGITSGVRQGNAPAGGEYPDEARIVDGDTAFVIRTDTFTGDTDALLTQIESIGMRDDTVATTPTPITTDQGHQGLMTQITGSNSQRVLAAFVFGDRGVQAVAIEPADSADSDQGAISRMIASIRHRGQDDQ